MGTPDDGLGRNSMLQLYYLTNTVILCRKFRRKSNERKMAQKQPRTYTPRRGGAEQFLQYFVLGEIAEFDHRGPEGRLLGPTRHPAPYSARRLRNEVRASV